jgi:hypothetical protein
MIENTAGTNQRGARLPYVKPFVRNLDVMDTEGNKTLDFPVEGVSFFGGPAGPS